MNATNLCRKCLLFLSGQLRHCKNLHANTPNNGYGSKQRWLCADSDNDKSEAEIAFRAAVDLQTIRSCLERWTDATLPNTDSLLFHHSLDDLKASAKHGCGICAQFSLRADEQGPSLRELMHHSNVSIPILSIDVTQVPGRSVTSHDKRTKSFNEDAWHQGMSIEFCVLNAPLGELLTVFYLPFEPAGTLPLLDTTALSQPREGTMNRISQWIKNCESHTTCRRAIGYVPSWSSGLPARLLKVNCVRDSIRAKVVASADLPLKRGEVRYATLSHRWNSLTKSASLCKANFSQFSEGIPVEKLPPTFRDAIRVVVALNLTYIWIDALCIIQDDQLDWQSEAPRMLYIYSGSIVNIAAATSQKNALGLFCQNSLYWPFPFEVRWEGSWLSPGKYHTTGHCDYVRNVEQAEIVTRGWIFQERLLSPRTIYFARDQIWWQCREQLLWETRELSVLTSGRPAPFQSFSRGDWADLVHRYSQTELSILSDRLVAISGVAEAFAYKKRYLSKDYAAGLWLPDVVEQLLWYRYGPAAPVDTSRMVEYIAPTWSWASVSGPVVMECKHPNMDRRNHQYQRSFELVEAYKDSTSRSPFGAIKYAALYIKTVLHRVRLYEPTECSLRLVINGVVLGPSQEPNFWRPSNKNLVYRFQPDSSLTLTEPKLSPHKSGSYYDAYFIPLRKCSGSTKSTHSKRRVNTSAGQYHIYSGLVVEREARRKGTYRRLGKLEIPQDASSTPAWWTGGAVRQPEEYLEGFAHRVYKIRLV